MTRFARFAAVDGSVHQAVLDGEELQVIRGDLFGSWEMTPTRYSLSSVKLLAPVVPVNILAIGLNYRAHANETNMPIPDHPVLFIKATSALCNPGDPIILPRTSEALYLLQRVRDEAHRTAIALHRKRRGKRATASVLDGIPGLGPAKAKSLLRHFGSVRSLRGATMEELREVAGIGPSLAGSVHAALHEDEASPPVDHQG
mgnify:CR=1 FL=1